MMNSQVKSSKLHSQDKTFLFSVIGPWMLSESPEGSTKHAHNNDGPTQFETSYYQLVSCRVLFAKVVGTTFMQREHNLL